MTINNGLTSQKPLRLWPAVVIALLQWTIRLGVTAVAPEAELFGLPLGFLAILAGVAGAIAIFAWWIFFSRAPWAERLGAIVLIVVALFATSRLVHESMARAGMGMMLYILALPLVSLALVVWAVATQRLPDGARRVALVAAIVLAYLPFTLMRTAGVFGGAGSEFHWRWTETPEQRLLAQASDEPKALPPSPAPAEAAQEPVVDKADDKSDHKPRPESAAVPPAPAAADPESAIPAAPEAAAEWPGFRGPERNSIIRGVRINTDWSASPPVEIWRRPIGPGWSSFAVRGDFLYTQEQRGDDEIVACYKVSTGEPVWRHRDPVRFWESEGGAGPRGTPTVSGNRVYAFGATGILNALDAGNGAVVWSRNVASDTGRKVPDWGFASSPLVLDDIVVVAAAGTLAAYDAATGNPRWRGPSYGGSYSSPHRLTIDGVVQIVLLGGPGAISVDPANGEVLWKYSWVPGPIVQPALIEGGDLLINAMASTGGIGTRRIAVAHEAGGWSVQERWTSNGLKPYFNDLVVHKGHAFGFDGSILSCIDLEDGKRKWKGGRYGNGQLVLLADQDVLLVLTEEGELALVAATSEQFKELARFPALNAKTWNHPVLVGDVLLVRNGEEMAAFRLSLSSR